jgi:hypothetical protein
MCVTNTTYRRSKELSLEYSLLEGFLAAGGLDNVPDFSTSEPSKLPECSSDDSDVTVARPKRLRKSQKPGKTAKLHDRHFVVHNYHDHGEEEGECDLNDEDRRRGGVSIAFPLRLHAVLDQVEVDGLSHIVSWQPHGRCFAIHKPKEFVDRVMPIYFRQTKLTSFQRQLNLYGFARLTRGPDAGGYYHERFLRGKTFLCKSMPRTKVKGTLFKAASSPDQEPDFYQMNPVAYVTPHTSIDDIMSISSESWPVEYASVPIPCASSTMSPLQPAVCTSSSSERVAEPENFVLDEALDELFFDDQGVEDEHLLEFIHDWDPNGSLDSDEDDVQLGFLLDRLLDEV